jgi:ankyrin repeat protein
MVAASQCSVDGVRKLIENGADPRLVDQRQQTALMAAASSRCFRNNRSGEESKARLTLLKSLIGSGALVNAQDDGGQTALIIAAKFANPEATKTLLGAGADALIKDHDGMTALTYAKNLQQRVHQTYNRHYWSHYERCYQEIIANLSQAEKK